LVKLLENNRTALINFNQETPKVSVFGFGTDRIKGAVKYAHVNARTKTLIKTEEISR